MKQMLKKTVAILMILCFVFSFAACSKQPEDVPEEPVQSVNVVNEIMWNDIDPSLLIVGENVVFNAAMSADDISFGGALRNLQPADIQIIGNSTLLISTQGKVYGDDAVGFINISENANSTLEAVPLAVSIDRTNYDGNPVSLGFWADLGLSALKGLAVTGLDKAFGYGLDKILYDKLGLEITTMTSIKNAIREVGTKIDALSKQMTEMEARLTDVINESTKEILTNEYLTTFESINTLVTRIKAETVSLWNSIASIESTADETSEEYRTLVIAELLTFSELEGKSVSPLVTDVMTAISYIEGSNFSLNPESLYSRILKIGCTRSVFTGEAAILVSEYLNTLDSIVGEALNAMSIVCKCKYYTYRQLNVTDANPEYKDVITFVDGQAVESKELIVNLEALTEQDADLKIRLTSSAISRYKDKANGTLWQDFLKQIGDYVTNVFDEKNPDSVLSKYNTFVHDRFNSYNKSYKVYGDYVDIDFVDLKTDISSNGSSECGLWGNGGWTDSEYKAKVKTADETMNYYIKKCMTSEEIDTFIQRLMSNESGLLFKDLTEETTYTIGDILKLYGFSVPSYNNMYDWYFATDNKTNGDGKLTVSGYPSTSSITVNKYGEITASDVKSEDVLYFDYNKQWEEIRFYFYYFTEETIIYSEDEFTDYIDRVVNERSDKSARLMVDLDLSGIDWNTVWPASKSGVEFRGTFDGNKHTISNFTVSVNTGNNIGLFRTVGKDAVIKNLTFENVNINCPSLNNVGACAGKVTSPATLSGITVASGTVTGGSNVGGIIGLSEYPNTLSNSKNCAAVSGKDYVAGLVGRSNAGGTETYSTCKNYGDITASGGCAAGIVGSIDGNVTFKNCLNEGKISAYKNAGGLVSSATYNVKITKSVNSGDVTSQTLNAGGLIGYDNTQAALTISGCNNKGNITGKNSAGGFVGTYYKPTNLVSSSIETSNNTGVITSEKYAGGFVGASTYFYLLMITDCSSSGDVTATGSTGCAGGIMGFSEKMLNLGLVNTTITGTVTGKTSAQDVAKYDTSCTNIKYQNS